MTVSKWVLNNLFTLKIKSFWLFYCSDDELFKSSDAGTSHNSHQNTLCTELICPSNWNQVGSLFYNLWTLHPKNAVVRALYFTLFPLSNVVALYHLYLAFWLRNPGAWYSYAFMVVGPVLALMRQLECNQDIKGRLPTYGPEPGTANAKKDD